MDNVRTDIALRERLLGFVRARAPSADAEDLVQEILLKAHNKQDQLKDDSRLDAWLYQIARNAIRDHFRKRQLPPSEDLQTPEQDNEAMRALSACLAPMIDSLDEKYAEALRLVELEERTAKEAARLAGISVSGMKSRVQRGRHQLKRVLLRCCAVELDVRSGIKDYSKNSGGCTC